MNGKNTGTFQEQQVTQPSGSLHRRAHRSSRLSLRCLRPPAPPATTACLRLRLTPLACAYNHPPAPAPGLESRLRLAPACARAGLESRRRPPAPAPAWRAAAAEKRIELVGFVFGAESVVWLGCLIILSTGAIRSIRKNSMHATPAGGPKGVAYIHNGNYQQLQQL